MMDAGIDATTRDLTGSRITTLANAVYLRLMTPLGSWWADPSMGSLLYTLRREKALPRVARQAEAFATEALQPLLDDGRATRVTVQAQPLEADGALTRVLLRVEVVEAGGAWHVFEHPVTVI